MQIQAGGGDLPQWTERERLWYVRQLGRHFAQFSMAVKAAMTGRMPEYREIGGKQK